MQRVRQLRRRHESYNFLYLVYYIRAEGLSQSRETRWANISSFGNGVSKYMTLLSVLE